jgi:Cu-Zn family superoxide dismutase
MELIVRSRTLIALALAPTLLLVVGCGDDDPPAAQQPGTATTTPAVSPTPSPGPTGAETGVYGPDTPVPTETVKAVAGAKTFGPWKAGATAVTYDQALVPTGATAAVSAGKADAGVKLRLVVTGLKPSRGYGAHLHTDPCAAAPASAGPHYQHNPDPKAIASPPSVDPKFANPRNEVWLDFTTDAEGAATVTATQIWPFDEISPPRSLILHAETTKTAAGKAGTAGDRVACVTLPL